MHTAPSPAQPFGVQSRAAPPGPIRAEVRREQGTDPPRDRGDVQQGNLDVAEELLAPDFVDHDPSMPEDVRGPEGFKEHVGAFRSAFSDLHVRIEDQVAEGDKVVQRWTGTGTHDGDLVGIAPTGNRVEIAGMEISRISGGKVAEVWEGYDAMGLMRQLGAIPSSEEEEQQQRSGGTPSPGQEPTY